MAQNHKNSQPIAIIGAGPAGLFGAKYLASQGCQVALFNRDIKPGGLAEYGIFHNKHKMKNGLRKQFRKLMESENIHYYGNILIGEQHDLSLDELRELGFQAILVAVGAQGTKWLGLEGEEHHGVYHAKDLVYHFNQLPPYSQQEFPIGERVVLIGVGNVMIDIANWVIRDLKVKEVTAVARRGPADVKFTKKEMGYVARNLDLDALDEEIGRTASILEGVGQDPEAAKAFILAGLDKAQEAVSDTKFRFRFLSSPKCIAGGQNGKVIGLEVENTTLKLREDGLSTRPEGLGSKHLIAADTIVFCIGDQIDPSLGLPLDKWNDFAKHPEPRFPVEDTSYEAYDPQSERAVEGVFLSGWAREASSGLVGTARKDGINGAKALERYLETLSNGGSADTSIAALDARLRDLNKVIIRKAEWERLENIEEQHAIENGLEHFKFSSNEEMLKAIGLLEQQV